MAAEIGAIRPSVVPVSARWDHGTQLSGSLIVAVSAVAFSSAGLFTRLIPIDIWTMLFWRGVFGGLLIAAFVAWQERRGMRAAIVSIGWAGLLAAACSTLSTICFISALRKTTVADVTVIYATAPFIAAGFAWVWTRERPGLGTLAASGLALAGVAMMCRGALSSGQRLGDLLAFTMTALLALMMVVIRRNRHVSMLPAASLSAFACALLVLPLAHPTNVTAPDLGLLGLFGTTQFGLGLLLLTIGSRRIPAARASLLSNLELAFAPLWVWLAFNERPSQSTLIGGGIVCIALILDVLGAYNRPQQCTDDVAA